MVRLGQIAVVGLLCTVLWGADEIRVQRLVAMPRYPLLAASARIQGEVKLRCNISGDGRVQKVDVLSGHPVLAKAATENALQWVFAVPASSEGGGRTFTLVYRFRLEGTCFSPNCSSNFSFEYPATATVVAEAPYHT